jgi:Fe-S cluster assembly scaffold protein SufB
MDKIKSNHEVQFACKSYKGEVIPEKDFKVATNDENICSICLENIVVKKGVQAKRVLACGHEFHRDCINKWELVNNICPLDRTEFSLEKETLQPKVSTETHSDFWYSDWF